MWAYLRQYFATTSSAHAKSRHRLWRVVLISALIQLSLVLIAWYSWRTHRLSSTPTVSLETTLPATLESNITAAQTQVPLAKNTKPRHRAKRRTTLDCAHASHPIEIHINHSRKRPNLNKHANHQIQFINSLRCRLMVIAHSIAKTILQRAHQQRRIATRPASRTTLGHGFG